MARRPRRLWTEINGEPWLINPVGETLTVVGALNPRRARRRGAMPRLRRRRYYRRRRRNEPARRRAFRFFNDPDPGRRRRRYYRRRRRNPVMRRYYRRRRHNPQLVLTRPASWLPYAMNAGLSAATAATLPALLWGPNITGLQAYSTQAATAIGGAFLANWIMRDDGTHALVWFVVHAGVIAADMIGKSIVTRAVGFVRQLVPGQAVVPTADGGAVVTPAAAPAAALAGFGQPYSFRARYYPTAMAPFVPRR